MSFRIKRPSWLTWRSNNIAIRIWMRPKTLMISRKMEPAKESPTFQSIQLQRSCRTASMRFKTSWRISTTRSKFYFKLELTCNFRRTNWNTLMMQFCRILAICNSIYSFWIWPKMSSKVQGIPGATSFSSSQISWISMKSLKWLLIPNSTNLLAFSRQKFNH